MTRPVRRSTALAALALLPFLASPAPAEGPWRLVEVRDGDTVTLRVTAGPITGIKIRLLGLDAPEARSGCPAERALAARATQRLKEVVSRRVRIASALEFDVYGRVLAALHDRDGRDVAAVLVAEGLARPLRDGEKRRPWCDAAGNLAP